MSEKKKGDKVVPQKPTDQSARLLVDPALTGGYRRLRRKSSLDDELEAEDDMQARELRDLRVKKLTLKREAEVAKLEREIKEIAELPAEPKTREAPKIPGISINVARQIAALPEEERNRVLETYMLMQAAEAKQANAVLPAIVGFARANPGSSPNQYMDFAKAMSDQFRTGVEVAQKMAPPQQDQWKPVEIMMEMAKERSEAKVDPWKPVEMVMDMVKESVREPLDRMSQSMHPQTGFFESLLMNPELFDRAKDLGIFGGRHEGGAGTSEMDLKIEQLRTERDLGMKKIDLEWKKSMLERESQDKRTDNLLAALAPLSAVLAGPVNQRMRQFGQQQAYTHNPGGPPGAIPPLENTILIKCSCGYQGPMTFPGPPPDTIPCPSCGQTLVVGGAPSGREPQETDRGT